MGRLSFVFAPEIGWSEFGDVRRLADRIRRGKARPLDSREIDLLCQGLLDKTRSSGVHPVHRRTMWMLLDAMPGHPRVMHVARELLRDPTAERRGPAFTYIAISDPVEAAFLARKYRHDPDAELLFCIGAFLQPSDPVEAVDVWIDAAVRPMTVQLRDDVELHIMHFGTATHLVRLQRVAKEMPNSRFIAGIVDNLARNLRSRSNS